MDIACVSALAHRETTIVCPNRGNLRRNVVGSTKKMDLAPKSNGPIKMQKRKLQFP
jgi:hypothetical protein